MLSIAKIILVFIISMCANSLVHLVFSCSSFWLASLCLYTIAFQWVKHLSLALHTKGI